MNAKKTGISHMRPGAWALIGLTIGLLFVLVGAGQAQEGPTSGEFTLYIPQMVNNHNPVNPAIEGVYYVSKTGDNGDGQTWATAWNELDQIDWDIIEPGDTINIDGGDTEMTYTTFIEIGQSGLPNNPITIQLSGEAGRNGKAIFFGGRSTPLPYCFQKEYTHDLSTQTYGIYTNDHSWLVIDGQKWGGFTMHGFERSAIRVERFSTDLLIRHVEAYDNGTPVFENGSWNSDFPGIRVAGKNITFERMLVHDNGQDAFQSLFGENNLENLVIRQSWLHNARVHPNGPESFNFCTHTDGLQIYDGDETSGVLFEETIIGPGLTQGVLLGGVDEPTLANVTNVTFRNVLAIKAADNNLVGYRETDSYNWTYDRVTLDCSNTKGYCIRVDRTGHLVIDSIIYDGLVDFRESDATTLGNCVWEVRGDEIGETLDPQFNSVSTDAFSLDDYSMPDSSPCKGKGSSITSVDVLLNLPDPRK